MSKSSIGEGPVNTSMNKKKTLYYGWIIVVAVWLIYFFVNNPPCYGTNVISTRLVLDHGWSEGVPGLSLSFHYLAIGLAAVPAGFLIQKIGAKWTIVGGSLIGIICYLVIRQVESETMYEFLFFLLGISVSTCASVACPSLINEWFEKDKSVPMAMLMTAGGIGGFLYPLLSERLTAVDIKLPWLVYCGMSVAAGLIAFFLVRGKSEKDERVSEGKAQDAKAANDQSSMKSKARSDEAAQPQRDYTLKDAAGTFSFYSLGLMVFTARGMFGGYFGYVLLYSVENGLSMETAAAVLSFCSAIGLAGRILAGLTDRLPIPVHVLAAIDYAILAMGPIALIFAKSLPMFVLAAFGVGFGFGFQNTLFPVLVPKHFGNKYFSVIYGVYNMVGSFGATLAPMMVLALRNLTGDFRPGFAVMAAFSIVCVFLAYFDKPKAAH